MAILCSKCHLSNRGIAQRRLVIQFWSPAGKTCVYTMITLIHTHTHARCAGVCVGGGRVRVCVCECVLMEIII